jgi:hypothetical protein
MYYTNYKMSCTLHRIQLQQLGIAFPRRGFHRRQVCNSKIYLKRPSLCKHEHLITNFMHNEYLAKSSKKSFRGTDEFKTIFFNKPRKFVGRHQDRYVYLCTIDIKHEKMDPFRNSDYFSVRGGSWGFNRLDSGSGFLLLASFFRDGKFH